MAPEQRRRTLAAIQPASKGPDMNPNELAVATYDSHLKAEQAVKSLQRAGFDMRHISIIGRDYSTDEQVLGFFNAGDRARFFGKFGAFWGGLAGRRGARRGC
jgi:hypothetical protein